MITFPTSVKEKLDELARLCDKYPIRIPLVDCARFLDMDSDSLRACIERGACPFGLGWLKKNAHSRAFCIPTVPFFLWYTQSVGYREG